MTSSDATFDNMQRAAREAVRVHPGLFVAHGAIITLLGIAAVVWPQLSSVAVDIYVGWILLFSGVVGLVITFFAPNVGASFGRC